MGKSLGEIESAFQKKSELKQPNRDYAIESVKSIQSITNKHREGTASPSHAILISEIIFYVALIAMVLCTGLFFSGNVGNKTIGNYRFLEMLTPSMQSVYPKGSLLLVDEVPIDELNIGDDISYIKDDFTIVTHRIEQIEEDYKGTGTRAFVTKGIDNPVNDPDEILAEMVIGRVSKSIPVLGAVLSWVARNLLFILMAFLILMTCSFGIKIFWHKNQKNK